MNWPPSIFIGILTAAASCFGAGLVAALCVRWHRISSFEGGSGCFMVSMALLGGIAGLIAGVVCARTAGIFGAPTFWKGLGFAMGTMGALLLVVCVFARLAADITPEMDGLWLELAIEARGPEGFTVPVPEEQFGAFASVYVPGGRGMPSGKLLTDAARQEDGRRIVTATVPLMTSARRKYLRAYFNKENDVIFPLPLRAHPNADDLGWSAWVASAWDAGKPEPQPEKKFGLRYRVQKITPPPPPPDPAVVAAEKFSALRPDSPLEEWLPFLFDGSPPERVTAVVKIAGERQAGLAKLILSSEAAVRERALDTTRLLPDSTPEIAEAVLAEGRAIAEGIRRFNTMKDDAADFWDVQIELRGRFNVWKQAWWVVCQRRGIDGRPPIQEIFDLATIRARGTTMDEIEINARVILDELNGRAKKTP